MARRAAQSWALEYNLERKAQGCGDANASSWNKHTATKLKVDVCRKIIGERRWS
jgi:hypothetical protein